jgi:hypothetical protein
VILLPNNGRAISQDVLLIREIRRDIISARSSQTNIETRRDGQDNLSNLGDLFEVVRTKPGLEAMSLTKQRSQRDPNKFPTVQLFLLGTFFAPLTWAHEMANPWRSMAESVFTVPNMTQQLFALQSQLLSHLSSHMRGHSSRNLKSATRKMPPSTPVSSSRPSRWPSRLPACTGVVYQTG